MWSLPKVTWVAAVCLIERTFVTKIVTESVSGKAADLERGVLCWQGVLAPLPDCLY